MNIKNRTQALIFILFVIVFIVEGLTLFILYKAALDQRRDQLTATARSQARLIESVARFDAKFSQQDHVGGSEEATLSQIRDANKNLIGFGKTGEFVLGKLENNNNMRFLLRTRFNAEVDDVDQDPSLVTGGSYAEPMQLALAGKSGTVVARDYRGEMVLAAYEPVAVLNYGVIAKIDLNEIREPFIRVGLVSALVAMLLIAIGAFLFLRISNPMIKHLKDSEVRFKEAQRLAKVGSWELNLINNNLLWSDEIFHIFEIDKSQFDASYDAFLNAIHPEDKDRVNQAYTDSLINRQPYEIVHRLQMSDGKIKHVRETCESFFDNDNKPLRSVGTIQDITEIVIAEAELVKYREHLEELVEDRTKELQTAQNELVRKGRLATLGQLTATVSHELRNPLGAMRPPLYILNKYKNSNDDRFINALNVVDRNIDRCDSIIDELLDFTRITDLERKTTCIDEWLESIINDQIIPKDIQLEKEFSLKDADLFIDSNVLRRAVINVIDNACHAMMDDNQKVKDKKNSRLKFKTQTNNDRIEIVISDTGDGISKDVLKMIFEPLFSTKGFGVGLGMPTVKQIMEQHGGGVEVDSEEGKGTTVSLWLPMTLVEETFNEVML